ncbi:hypothetical protein BC332_14143 [Capsicum chinense]|nr:hypothetical protein BC332_14143 [Capsicum chinense]
MTPLFMAAESGFHDTLINIMESCKKLTYAAGPSNRKLLHAAVIQEHRASEGGINMINKLLYHCPDCWDTLNSKNQNALHVDEEKLVEDLCSIGRFGKCDFEVKRKYKYMPNPNDDTGTGAKIQLNDETGIGVKMQLREDDHDKAKKADKTVIERGFESDSDSHNQGMAILIRKIAFSAFVFPDAIAFTFSSVTIFIYLLVVDESRNPQHKKIVRKLYDLAGICQCLSLLAVVIAFATANEGHTEVVRVLLACIEGHNTKEKLTRMPDASGDTALHKTVRSQHLDVVNLLVKEDSEFEFPPNHAQETPLYLAAECGFHDTLINILESCKKLTYAAGSENAWTTAIHIAASEGDVNMINELLNHCPDCRDFLNNNSQNALHVAALKNQEKEKLMEDLCSIGRFGKRDSEVKRKYKYMPNPNDETRTGFKMQLRENDHDKDKKVDQIAVESIMKSARLHIIVATLIMIVTFAAGITLPGGFESNPYSLNQGMAILIRKTSFRAFVVSDAIAFTFSAVAIFIYFLMADIDRGVSSLLGLEYSSWPGPRFES